MRYRMLLIPLLIISANAWGNINISLPKPGTDYQPYYLQGNYKLCVPNTGYGYQTCTTVTKPIPAIYTTDNSGSASQSSSDWNGTTWNCPNNNCVIPVLYSGQQPKTVVQNGQLQIQLNGITILYLTIPTTSTWGCVATSNGFTCSLQAILQSISWQCPTINTSTCATAAGQMIGVCNTGAYYIGKQNFSDGTSFNLSSTTNPATPSVTAYYDGTKAAPANISISGVSYYDKFDGGFWCVYRDPNYASSGFQAFSKLIMNGDPDYFDSIASKCSWDSVKLVLSCTP